MPRVHRPRLRRQDEEGALALPAAVADGAVEPAPPSSTLAVVGCGNLLRGDDGVGVRVVQRLGEGALPPHVRLVDAGTGGIDVLFALDGVERAIVVDGVASCAEPGTVFHVPGEELEALPPPDGVSLHAFRWDHALALGRMMLKQRFPSRVDAYLIEVETVGYGLDLSEAASRGAERVVAAIRDGLA